MAAVNAWVLYQTCIGARMTRRLLILELCKQLRRTKDQTVCFIKLRAENEGLFSGAKFSANVGWKTILEKMGLQEKVTPAQAKKKWDNLKKKYKDCKYPGTGEGVAGKPTAATWPWFVLMDEVLGQRPSSNPPVLIASIEEDRPGPSSAVGSQSVEEVREDPVAGRGRRKRKAADQFVDLIREDMRLQREAEERREAESRERMDRLFSLLEKFVNK
ncbi:uncharacterized protein LOC121644312 [Melanotaenia boesemani]|uniref:uncharacterized protein LOC121644312 n=1 Tax=Melanotaenia boesemani TaxID=1250792 RepID=UPI001C059740|nr:uncharacterized protein LOC121644312 [Melanotaenia boesemani]